MRDRKKLRLTCEIYENIKLDDNEHKCCWEDMSFKELFNLVKEEYLELISDIENMEYENAIYECADLRNATGFLMQYLHKEIYEKMC